MNATPPTSYLRRWARLPRELGFVLASLPIVLVSCILLWVGVGLGIGLVILWIGIPILLGTLLLARSFGALEIVRLRAAGVPVAVSSRWATGPGGLVRRALRVLGDGRYWRHVLHGAIVNPILGIVTWSIGLAWIVVSLGGPSYWFWNRFDEIPDNNNWWFHGALFSWVNPSYHLESTLAQRILAENILFAVIGVLFLLTLPLVIRPLVLLHALAARTLLGEGRTAALKKEAADAETSRYAAVLAEDSGLRRLERDIHDGPQQGLLRIQLDLAGALRRLEDGDRETHELVEASLQLTKETLNELRQLSQGLAPPLLQDRGLIPAVRSLADRSTVAVTVDVDIDDSTVDLTELERSVYFVIAELLTNVSKHAQATSARVALSVESAATGGQSLVIRVSDDGRGGAAEHAGGGLSGLRSRITGLRGSLAIDSPPGGPTVCLITIPVPRRTVADSETVQ